MPRVASTFAVVLVLTLGGVIAPASAEAEGKMAGPARIDISIIRTTDGIIKNGDPVTFTGTAPKRFAGTAISLQRKTAKSAKWVTLGRARIRRDGTWAATGRAAGSGSNFWRATFNKNRTRHASKTIKHKVYQWYYLYDLEPVTVDDYQYEDGPITIGGHRYPKSFGADHDGYGGSEDRIEFNASYRCVQFQSAIGISDASDSGSTGDFFFSADGARVGLGSKGLGVATDVTQDISGILRVIIEWQLTSDTYGYPSFGDPKMLCAGKP